jgi:hypothetical protein
VRKRILVALLSFVWQYCISQDSPDVYNNKDFIVWGTKDLHWDDFRGPVLSKKFQAGTYGGFSYYWDANGKLYWFAYFSKNKSWHRGESDLGLRHEKFHFDVVEIYARKLRKAIIQEKLSMNNVDKINTVINKIWDECEAMQHAYDAESKHAKNQKAQTQWEKRIEEILDSLKDYSSIIVN